MTVRDPRYTPRSRAGRGRDRSMIAALLVVGAIVVLGLITAFAGVLMGGGVASPLPSPSSAPLGSPAASSAGAAATPTPSLATESVAPSSPAPSSSTQPATQGDVAIVPVTSFRSAEASVARRDLDAIAGGSGTYTGLVLVGRDADAILAAVKLDRAGLGRALTTVADAAALRTSLAAHRTWLGFLRADEVAPSVRALAWGPVALFGVDRVRSLADWPLRASVAVSPGASTYDPGTAWTMVAGGDILLDRGVALAIKAKGVDFPFDGGTADITGTCKDCSPFGWDLPYTKRTGGRGLVRDLIKGADIAIANFENPAPDAFRFHGKGTVFSANPAYIRGLKNAGIDWVSLANNHIGDAGRTGMLQTLAHIDDVGIAHGGLGANTKAAHAAALLKAGGVTVGLLGYDTIAPTYNAGATTPGSARMTAKALKADIRAARAAGAQVVVVMPHWGVEYRATPIASERALAHAAIDAGADMVIGNHPHWAGAMEVYEGKPIWYALGNLVFDQTWSIPTMEGITLELTFNGTSLLQARIRPHLILDKAQPNFLDPRGDGRAVLSQVFKASKGLLPW